MYLTKRLIAILLCALLCAPALPAQDKKAGSQANNTAAPLAEDVTIIIFIVDRVKDRDGTDKLWITSQNSSGIGTELTVARDEDTTVAGTATSSERTLEQRGENQKRGNSERGIETEAENQTAAAKTAAAALAAGTVGQIAKFTSATDLGNSVMTEANGNVGIGTASPSGRLHIVGSADTAGTLRFQPAPGKGANQSHVHWGATGDWYIRSAAATGKVILQDTGGSVAIGAATPIQARLYAFNNNGNAAVRGENSANGNGVVGSSDSNDGVVGTSRTGKGVRGLSPNSIGVYGESAAYVGVFGKSTQFEGVRGESNAAFAGGVVGYNLNTGIGVYGQSNNGIGMQARSVNGTGMDGGSTNGIGVYGISQGANGFGGYFRNTGGGVALNVEGKTRTGVLEITGGADFAENFDINAAETIKIATATKVEAIEPGDLLTTSATAGHAMKAADPAKAQGAVIGKAMTGLKEGKGLVLVLVTLQ